MAKKYIKKDTKENCVNSANAVPGESHKKSMRKVMTYFEPVSFPASAGANAIESVISKRKKKA